MLKKIFRLITSIFGSEISEFIGDTDIDLDIGLSADNIEDTVDASEIGLNTIKKVTTPKNKLADNLDKTKPAANIPKTETA